LLLLCCDDERIELAILELLLVPAAEVGIGIDDVWLRRMDWGGEREKSTMDDGAAP
jgi:hypothetical protein